MCRKHSSFNMYHYLKNWLILLYYNINKLKQKLTVHSTCRNDTYATHKQRKFYDQFKFKQQLPQVPILPNCASILRSPPTCSWHRLVRPNLQCTTPTRRPNLQCTVPTRRPNLQYTESTRRITYNTLPGMNMYNCKNEHSSHSIWMSIYFFYFTLKQHLRTTYIIIFWYSKELKIVLMHLSTWIKLLNSAVKKYCEIRYKCKRIILKGNIYQNISITSYVKRNGFFSTFLAYYIFKMIIDRLNSHFLANINS